MVLLTKDGLLMFRPADGLTHVSTNSDIRWTLCGLFIHDETWNSGDSVTQPSCAKCIQRVTARQLDDVMRFA